MARLGLVRKDAAIENTGDTDAFPGTFSVILSAPTEDRDGDVLRPEEWDLPLPDHITFDQDHGMTVASTVGSGSPYIDKQGRLIVDGTYSSLQRAQDVRTLVNEGHIKTTSVAFMNKEVADPNAKSGKKTRVVRELLNGAFVAIPSNREALVLTSKSGARNSKADQDMLQTVHDHAVSLGAACSTKTVAGGIEQKAIVGSLEHTRERAQAALSAANPDAFTYIRGTLPDGDGGTLVYVVEDPETYKMETFEVDYTDDGSTLAISGEPRRVTVEEVVGRAGGGSSTGSESDGAEIAADTAPVKSGTVDATKTAPTPDEATELEERARKYRANYRLAATS